MIKHLFALCASVVFADVAFGQGTDACTTPTVISGAGPFAFNNGSATTGTQGQNNALCNLSGQIGITRDVWFVWTAPSTGTFTLSLCAGGVTFDSKVAVYQSNGCPATAAIACNDDACNLQSQLMFSATSGLAYTIQLGTFPNVAGGTGTFTISTGSSGGCNPATSGPDVIVGDLTGPSNYAVAAGIDALSLGTSSCNIGDAVLQWQASNPNHPVIGGNLYRYKVVNGAGRFEHVGMSWLKHGFTALTQNLCCTCINPGTGSLLGIGCSDPYTSARNGSQSGLGPRWQVNANTGAFTYPPANPSWSGTTARRLEVATSDLEVTGGTTRYFGESHYVTPDDAAAGNQDNNASWRELSVTGSPSDFNFAFVGNTQRSEGAIRAWKVADSAVTLTDVQLPSEGFLVLGSRVTALGGGTWHYEFALYNMNSDDSIRSFSLPIQSGVTITNAGFHDVPYRNGDGPGNVNFDGADWSASQAGGALAWSTQTFAQNASANALRWGSTYNFRFDANTAPVNGTITLGRFKSGGSQTVNAPIPSVGNPPADGDGDGVPDASDNCPSVANANQLNADGDSFGDACDACTDTDGDGYGNPGFPGNTCTLDLCPNDPLKHAPGACGCGVPETDGDGDGTPNCIDGCPNDPLKIAPGVCGCGVADTDSDGDGTPNCNDGCPNDPTKIVPGLCGCGVADTDSDGDGTPNCHDGCPTDPLKIAPGLCGCGVADTDSDGDGTPNCNDGCPTDPLKVAPGQCGCGVADTDSDGDGTPNCHDGCPTDPLKIAPGLCGCGVADTDSDSDGTPNCNDGCPTDPLKLAPGVCGCGVADTDSDGDGTPNCNDGCPTDPLKVAPGQCGCGVADTDSDGDGTPNCHDGCPTDPLKIAPGLCGCGVADTDSDSDGTPNCNDGCPTDPLKTAPGVCGCGVADTDTDGDGTPNCNDGCPNDPLKLAPGVCGCGVADTDSDGDGTPNCNDGCPTDPLKITAGVCGCGVADTDTDGDGTPNCNDGCPNDPLKLAPGVCGCGVADTDSDGDGTPNCNDGCPTDPLKITAGVCGCGVADTDTDGDGTPNCNDGCPTDPLKLAPGVCGCGVADTDSDGDGTPNCNDGCPTDPLKITPGLCGCGVADTDSDGDGTPNCNDGCPTDPLKLTPGLCGCGVADTDTDGDGAPNCTDGCPNDPLKLVPGLCGCGVADTDSDGDGTPNCNDGCPTDPLKVVPGICGCGVSETDSDGDGAPNCTDGCPNDPLKIAPGQCGCGVVDSDGDSDGVATCIDNCPTTPNPTQADGDSDGRGDECDNCATLANPTQADCDADNIGDACEIAAGALDCNLNGIPDACDIASLTSADTNLNAVPDECETTNASFCFGDGTGTPCPCGNNSAVGQNQGCLNSLGLGAALVASGTSSIVNDTLMLTGSNMPNSFALYFQGTTQTSGGAGSVFGDGKRCAGGNVIRLGTFNNVGGGSSVPNALAPTPIHTKGAITAPSIRTYQIWYRNAAAFCTPSTFNLSNGTQVIWTL